MTTLTVHLHDRRIGVIARIPGERHLFVLDEDYLADPARPTLSLSLKTASGGIQPATRPLRRRLPPFFANLMPEGHLREYLASRAGVNPAREFFLLAALGADLPGTVSVRPEAESSLPPHELPPGPPGATGPLRFSLAGVQLKFSAVVENSGGLTIPAHGIGGSWIVKLPSLRFDTVSENEFVMLTLARAVGIDVPPLKLLPVASVKGIPEQAAALPGNALAVERFDRSPAGPVHMEDFAQVFGVFPDDKYKAASYDNIGSVLWNETGEAGFVEFLRRLVFSVLIGNADMHLKNLSLLYPDTRTPVLSPAYDLVSTLPYLPGDTLALNLGGSKEFDVLTPDRLRRFASRAGAPYSLVAATVREIIERTLPAWSNLDARDLLPAALRARIHAHIEKMSGPERL